MAVPHHLLISLFFCLGPERQVGSDFNCDILEDGGIPWSVGKVLKCACTGV